MVKKISFTGKSPGKRMTRRKSIEELQKENTELKESLKTKIEEYNELKERYKAICACYCFTLGTDFD